MPVAPPSSAQMAPSSDESLVRFLVLDLFSGVGGAMYALRAAGLADSPSVRHIIFETDPLCIAVLREHLASPSVLLSEVPDSQGVVGSVLKLTDDGCAFLVDILERLPNLVSVFILGGSPCQGLSRANPNSRLLEFV